MSASNLHKPRVYGYLFLGLLYLFLSTAQAQLVVPTFGTRGVVPDEIVSEFMDSFRSELRLTTGMTVSSGDLITQGIAGSLEPEFTYIIADLGGGRYGLSGEVARSGPDQYSVSILMGDAETKRISDVVSRSLSAGRYRETAEALAETVQQFLNPEEQLAGGEAELLISSQPADAVVIINGVRMGAAAELGTLKLEPGRVEIEFRKDGYLPETRVVTLEPQRATLVNVSLTEILGGSIQISSMPEATVWLDGERLGVAPLTVQTRPGVREVRLERPGFEDQILSVRVRNFRVSRVVVGLKPAHEQMLFWDAPAQTRVFIGNRLQQVSYATDIPPGLRYVELWQGETRRRFPIIVPTSGVYEIDIEGQRLVPYEP